MSLHNFIVAGTILSSKAKNTDTPKYQKLAAMLRGQTETGQLKSGQKLPPVREIAYQMGVTAGTIARSYRSLIDEGYLKVDVGQRTY